jgi:beta-phosphoglucomutase-like phosphatase (HAD superfamily)
MDISAHINFYAGAEDCDKGKPAPDGYLKAAEFLQTDANQCLVFEDSIPGIKAARNAGMQVVAVTYGSHNVEQVSSMADMAIKDYSELEDHFFERIRVL